MHRKRAKYQFWRWFKRNNEEFLQLDKKTKKEMTYWIHELTTHLDICGRSMDFIVSNDIDEGSGTLTISARCNSDYFKRIDDFVALAPAIPNWKINALIQPYEVGSIAETVFDETGLDVQETYF